MAHSFKIKNLITPITNNDLFDKDKSYAGIGARVTPFIILGLMQAIASKLEKDNFHLRSGGAAGADRAFSKGCINNKNKTIYIPYDGFEGLKLEYPITKEALHIASNHHPNWNNLEPYARQLMARNVYQIFSHTLSNPVKFVICWTKDSCIHYSTRTRATGGTGLAIELASGAGIPVFNLNLQEHYQRFVEYTQFSKTEFVRNNC